MSKRNWWLGLAALLYVGFVVLFYRGRVSFLLDPTKFMKWEGMVMIAFVILVPFYIFCLWRYRRDMIPLDFHMLYLPFLVWYVAGLIHENVDKGLFNCLLEVQFVAVVCGLYLIRYPLARKYPRRFGKWFALLLVALVLLGAVSISQLVPAYRD